jgi:hypothetical protein
MLAVWLDGNPTLRLQARASRPFRCDQPLRDAFFLLGTDFIIRQHCPIYTDNAVAGRLRKIVPCKRHLESRQPSGVFSCPQTARCCRRHSNSAVARSCTTPQTRSSRQHSSRYIRVQQTTVRSGIRQKLKHDRVAAWSAARCRLMLTIVSSATTDERSVSTPSGSATRIDAPSTQLCVDSWKVGPQHPGPTFVSLGACAASKGVRRRRMWSVSALALHRRACSLPGRRPSANIS